MDTTTPISAETGRRVSRVPALGLGERCVMDALGVTWGQLQPLYGHEIGAPRDYVWRRTGSVFTAEGVRRLAAHFGLLVDVVSEDETAAPLESITLCTSRGGRRHFHGPWYLDFT